MKTSLPALTLRCLFAAALSAAVLTRADDDGAKAAVKLSAPGKPATLQVNIPWADIRISGGDGDTVAVESTINQKGGKETRDDGLRRLDDEVSFELTEHNNIVSLRVAGENPWASRDAEFKITVPRAMALDIKTEAGGDLAVKDVDGDIEVNNMNGEVQLEGIAGATVVNTMNGEVHVIYAKAPQKLVSITSMNGEVDLHVPADTRANVRLLTHNGSILTDFDETVLKTKSEGRGRNDLELAAASHDYALIITIQPDGSYTLGTSSAPVSLDELTKATTKAASSNKDATVLLRTAENADLRQVTAAMDACRKAGLSKIRLQSANSYDPANSSGAARMGADAARMAADATRAAMEIAREVSREVKREVERAEKEESDSAPVAEPDAAPAPAPGTPSISPVPAATPAAPAAPMAPRAPHAPRAPRPPIPPITGGKVVSGTLNGGGVDIKISTMNGEITLRQTK